MKTTGATAYLGLGSNIGNRTKNLELAISTISEHPEILVCAASSFYESEPVGYEDQDWFINQVVRIETSLSPYELLKVAHRIENIAGRKREIRWGPRTLDIDILLYGEMILKTPILTIPHPFLPERRFVLVPLAEIAPSLKHPVLGISVSDMLIDSPTEDLVKRI